MKRNLGRLAACALVAGLAVGCKKDPTTILVGTGPQYITTSVSYIALAVGDSLLVSSQTRDLGNNPLPDTAAVASSDATIASVSDYFAKPLPQKRFYVKGVKKGSTTISLAAGSATASIKVTIN